MKTAVIILDRGGSKGVPKKNIIDFCGKRVYDSEIPIMNNLRKV